MSIKSRLLKRLDAEIAASTGAAQSASLKVQCAVLFVRHGQMSRAREDLTALHLLAFQHPNPEIAAWLHYAEGLMSYYTDFSSAAQEKVVRAHAMAKAAGLSELSVLCCAWLAQFAYLRHDLPEMLAQVRACDAQAKPDDHDARYRLCTVLGLAHDLTGRPDLSRDWYAKARAHAQAEGDDASLSALMYNMAATRAAQVRRDALSQGLVKRSGLLLGADSIRHYDAAVGGSVLSDLTPVLCAQILTVEGDYAQARALFEEHLPQTMVTGLARWGSSLLADLAWCRVNLGQSEMGLQQALEAESELGGLTDADDKASTHSRLAQVFAALGDKAKAARHEELATQCWSTFAQQQQAWAQALSDSDLRPR
ncbi:hypothetical protein LNV08_21420 [Paucibacter sp. TC2R-5]|uniref:hypothetical protein n=1 Tax=Paucibacter sp. TC2R-5 TaxID=2893555 RepID=UPI0021E37E55|nr:hypothetical protein [Paucibacter sp. TC2R-5]MCV2361531.1 hypothetical protein [Paucibacter sp. TC2R-5]